MLFNRKNNLQDNTLRVQIEQLEERQLLSSVDILAAGATGQESIQLKIQDAVVKTWHNVSGDIANGHFETLSYRSQEWFDVGQVKVEFINDEYDPVNGLDRNVRVDKIIVDGNEYQTEDPSVFSTGTWLPGDGIADGYRQSEWLHTNGYFHFAGGSEDNGSQDGGTTLEITFRGQTGDEEFIVEASGETLAYWNADTEFQTYTVTTDREITPEQVRLTFVNDLYATDYDRNLIVDKIVINGQTIETESDSVFSTGTWLPEDGIQPGFRNSEYLHSNGYFQFGPVDGGNTGDDNGDHGNNGGENAGGLGDVKARNEFGVENDIEFLQDPSLATPLVRVTAPSYPGDGSGAQWNAPEPGSLPTTAPNFPGNVGNAVQPLEITNKIYAPGSEDNRPNSGGLNEYSIFFSQFLTHDMVHSVRAAGPPIFYDGQFIPVSRTPAIVDGGVLQQVSSDTPTLDLGLVYGRNEAATDLLREYVNQDGHWIAGAKLISGGAGDVLPSYAEVAAQRGKTVEEVFATLGKTFLNLPPEALANQAATGDERANQTTSLTAHHTIWHRNHNWHVDNLRSENPDWSEAQLYEAARAMNEAEYQSVVYNEYLPKLMGDRLSEYSGYDPHVDNSIINEWTTVAFRFGHDQSSSGQITISESGEIGFVPLEVSSLLANSAQNIKTDEALGDWIRGQLAQSSQEIDGRIVSSLRNALFGVPANQDGNDGSEDEFLQLNLPLLDIHRGRDHGVSDYNHLRAGLGLSTYSSLEDFAYSNGLTHERLNDLKSVYSDISELDSIVGGLLEAKLSNSQLGETFTLLNVMQFEATRDGDEFFYLNRFKDSPEILAHIESTSMNDILLRNGVVETTYVDAFQANNRFTGSNQSDLIYGTPLGDLLVGNAGNDELYGGEGNDSIIGGKGSDNLYGQGQNDFIDGGKGHDVIYGGWGDDVLVGGSGTDHLVGGQNNDIFKFAYGSDVDIVHDFTSGDKIDLTDFGFSSSEELQSYISHAGQDLKITIGSNQMILKGVSSIESWDVYI